MKKTTILSAFIILAASALLISSCSKSSNSNNTPPPTPTLYDSLGGTAMVADPTAPGTMIEKGRLGIRSVVDSTIFVIAADPAINNYFMVLLAEVTAGNLSGFEALSKNLTDFLCVGTGAADFTYTGKSMVDAHNPSTNSRISEKVDSGDFDEFINDVVKGAQKNNLPVNLIGSVGAVLETLKTQVVQR